VESFDSIIRHPTDGLLPIPFRIFGFVGSGSIIIKHPKDAKIAAEKTKIVPL
jgi:hypothetical protein